MSGTNGFWSNLLQRFKTAEQETRSEGEGQQEVLKLRRKMVTGSIAGVLGVNFLMFLRFFFPRTLFEPKTVFVVGYPADFSFGVDTRFEQADRVWIVRDAEGIFAIFARCTHLGCTPNWEPSENIFKCPCHGSGYDSEGINFEGPAPRPMDRAHIELLPTGQIQVDTSRLYQYTEFGVPGSVLRGI